MHLHRNPLSATVLAFVLAACASSSAGTPHVAEMDKYPPGVNGRTTIDYYDVQGRTLAELRADMRRKGPRISDSSFVGETRSPMRWTWKTHSEGPSTCSISDVTISVNAQILLPRWTPPADTTPGLYTEWQRFLTALETHESGHKDIAAKAARELQTKLRDLFAPCNMISTRAEDIARTILDKAHIEQRQYDSDTRHGITQGTGFGSGLALTLDKLSLTPSPRNGSVAGPVLLSLEKAWSSLPAAYAAIGLAINARDSSGRSAGDSITFTGKLGQWTAGEVIDCASPSNQLKNDSVRVTLFVTTHLEPDAGRTLAMTTVQAFTRLANGTAVGCRSRGTIERRLFQEIRARADVP